MKIINMLIPAILLIGCQTKKTDTPSAEKSSENSTSQITLTDAQLKHAALTISNASIAQVPQKIQVNGVVDVPPQNMVSISFPMGGYLKSTSLLPGLKVKKGQVIAIMEDPSFIQLQQDYLVSSAKLDYLQKDFERQQSLNNTKTSSDKQFEQVKSEYLSQRIYQKALSEKLKLIGLNPAHLNENNLSRTVNIYAPINGYVSDVKVNIGKYVNPSDILFELVNPDDLHLALTIFEKDIMQLEIGQKVLAALVNDSSKKYVAEIIVIGKTLDANRSTLVHCHFLHAEHGLLPGMFLTAAITTQNKEGLSVPEESVVQFGDHHYVFIQKATHQFEMIGVSPGITSNGYVQLQNAGSINKDSRIVTKNAYTLLMKLKNKTEAE